MKNIVNRTIACAALAVAAWGLTACSDAFLEEKIDYNNASPEIYNTYEGARARVNDLYAWCMPDGKKISQKNGMNMGDADDMSKSTEEYAGFGKWVDPQKEINIVSGNDKPNDWFYIQLNNIQEGVYGRIRNVNDVIAGIENGTLSETEKNELLGQAYFWRAWCYYLLVKWYGGVPLVSEVLEPAEDSITPRSSARESFQFIFDDLDAAATMLKNVKWDTNDWGRITAGTAIALKGRVMNLWASPMFNRKNDPARWQAAYDYQKSHLQDIIACGYGLVDAKEKNAEGWANLFVNTGVNPEAVMLTIHNSATGDEARNSTWENKIRPTNTNGGGGLQPSDMMIDLFPMKDGKLPKTDAYYPALPHSAENYDRNYPWLNRDPRFYRTFAFPGMRWTYQGTPTVDYYPAAASYTLWSYVWYTEANKANVENEYSGSSQGPDGNTSAKGFYVRKRTCDGDAGASITYVFSQGFARSATPWIEIRYTEVLLNLAEAAAGANDPAAAIDLLRQLRMRVGYEDDCGIPDDLDQQATMSAVLYERQIELAYEGKRFDDMRRWMLFDGGVGQGQLNPSWELTGWGGNTCDWLGVKPFNGRRREYYEFRVKDGFGGTTYDSDPLKDVTRPEGVDLRQELDPQLETLKSFYSSNLAVKIKKGDEYEGTTKEDRYILFRPHYYFLGLTDGAQSNNRTLPQTVGWEDSLHGGANGTFDPLAETAE